MISSITNESMNQWINISDLFIFDHLLLILFILYIFCVHIYIYIYIFIYIYIDSLLHWFINIYRFHIIEDIFIFWVCHLPGARTRASSGGLCREHFSGWWPHRRPQASRAPHHAMLWCEHLQKRPLVRTTCLSNTLLMGTLP